MPGAGHLSTKELNAAWNNKKKRKVSDKVNVGDHLGVLFKGAEYHVVITKVNKVTFNVEYDDGSIAEKVAINDERGPYNPDGVWRRVSPDTVFATSTTTTTTVESEDELPEDLPLSSSDDDDSSSSSSDSSSSSSDEESDEEEVEEVVVMSSQKRRRLSLQQ